MSEQNSLEVTTLPSPERPTLREDTRSRTQDRILDGAVSAVAQFGLDVTIDEIAAVAGVSRRTIFRHYTSHADLLVQTIDEIRRRFDENMPVPPSPGDDVETWLIESTVRFHEVFRSSIGRAFWDLHVDRPRISRDVAARIADVPVIRRNYARNMAVGAWHALGADGVPPDWVIDAFSLHISGFATYAHPNQSGNETGQSSARILWLVLQEALRQLAWSAAP